MTNMALFDTHTKRAKPRCRRQLQCRLLLRPRECGSDSHDNGWEVLLGIVRYNFVSPSPTRPLVATMSMDADVLLGIVSVSIKKEKTSLLATVISSAFLFHWSTSTMYANVRNYDDSHIPLYE